MKKTFLFGLLAGLLWIAATPSQAGLSAYQALERMTALKGPRALEHVIAVRSFDAAPHPSVWIVSRRQASRYLPADLITPAGKLQQGTADLSAYELPLHAQPLRFSMLNMDSGAAFRIADRAISRHHFSYDWVDYSLFMYPLAGTPAWTLTFYNPKHQRLARVTISATTGAILRPPEFLVYLLEDSSRPLAGVETLQEPFHQRAWRSITKWTSRTFGIFGRDTLRALSTTEEILIGDRTRDDLPTTP